MSDAELEDLLREAQLYGHKLDPALQTLLKVVLARLTRLESNVFPHEAVTTKRPRPPPPLTPSQLDAIQQETRILVKEDLPPVLDPRKPK
jgi:hypothetical protein